MRLLAELARTSIIRLARRLHAAVFVPVSPRQLVVALLLEDPTVISTRAVRPLRASFRRLASVCLAIAVCVVVSACTSIPKRPGASVETLSPTNVAAKSPIDVVVAPIANPTGDAAVPTDFLRESVHSGLVKRRYSPLALAYVDRKVVDAGYKPGSLQEEAVLQVTVERWDATLWESHRALNVRIHARMIDATNPSGGDLWAGRLERRFDVDKDGEITLGGAGLMKRACQAIAAELLAALPARDPAPGPVTSER